MNQEITVGRALILASVICFVVAAVGFHSVALIPIGLGLFAAGHLV